MSRSIYRVAVNCVDCEMGPHKVRILVVAENKHMALDKATDHPNAKRLWNENIQRSIADGEISEHRIERRYNDYIEEVEFVGEL